MYKLSRKKIAGVIVASSIILLHSSLINSQENHTLGTICLNLDLLKQKTEKTLEEIMKENHSVGIDKELENCIVYKIQRKENINGVWSGWKESSTMYIGIEDELYNTEMIVSEEEIQKKVIIGYIQNVFDKKDFMIERRTYHKEIMDTKFINGKEQPYSIVTGEKITLENSTRVPKECMARWVLDDTEYEQVVPEKAIANQYSWIVNYTESRLQEDGTWLKEDKQFETNAFYEVPEDSEIVQYTNYEKTQKVTQLPQLFQKYKIMLLDGNEVYVPTEIYTTIGNIPNTDKDMWIPVGTYEESPELKQELQANEFIKA